MILPPRNIPPIGDDGLIDPRWYQFFTRFGMFPGVAQALAYVTVSGGVPTLQPGSLNIASITDSGVGLLTIAFQQPFSSANWAAFVTSGRNGSPYIMAANDVTKTAGGVRIDCYTTAEALADPDAYNFMAFGAQ